MTFLGLVGSCSFIGLGVQCQSQNDGALKETALNVMSVSCSQDFLCLGFGCHTGHRFTADAVISSYLLLVHGLTDEHQAINSQTVSDFTISGNLTSTASNFIVPQSRTDHFYLLHIIHKLPWQARCFCLLLHLNTSPHTSILLSLIQSFPTYAQGTSHGFQLF